MTQVNITTWRADIDGLRAVAVLLVVGFHAFPSAIPGGFVGVDIFFAISGYLISGLLLKEHRDGRFSLIRFYERRVRRLFPALAAMVVCTVVAAYFISHPYQVIQTARHGIAASLSAANIAFWLESGYFDTASRLKPLLNLWSLGVEEQFYLLWPLLLAGLVRTRFLLTAVMLGCLASLAATESINEVRRGAVFYLPMFRAWELGLGALVAIIESKGWTAERFFDKRAAEVAVTAGLGLTIGSAFWINAKTPFPGLSALPAVAGSALVIWFGKRSSPLSGLASRLLSSRPFVFVGLISYSLYLWHWPLLTLPATAGVSLNPSSRLVIVALAIVLSAVSYRYIEAPARYAKSSRRAALLAVGALFVAAAVSAGVIVEERVAGATPERIRLAAALDWPSREESRERCPVEISQMKPEFAYCRASSLDVPSRVVWGDSHADHLFLGLASRDPHHTWLMLGQMDCPPAVAIDVIAVGQPDCRARAENALQWITAQPGIKAVVIGFFGQYAESTDVAQDHLGGIGGPSTIRINGAYDKATKAEALAQGLDRSIAQLLAAGKSVVVVIDVPELPFSPRDCFMPPRIVIAMPRCEVSRALVGERQAKLRAILSSLAAKYPVIRVVDPLPTICNATTCGVGTALNPIYRDSNHLSQFGSYTVAGPILNALELLAR